MSRPYGYLLPIKDDLLPDRIIAEMARGFDVSVSEILSRGRSQTVFIARACAMALIREATNMSYPEIGDLFDRDHTTVMYNVKKVLEDPELGEAVRSLADELVRLSVAGDAP